jgi:hypothetical protein
VYLVLDQSNQSLRFHQYFLRVVKHSVSVEHCDPKPLLRVVAFSSGTKIGGLGSLRANSLFGELIWRLLSEPITNAYVCVPSEQCGTQSVLFPDESSGVGPFEFFYYFKWAHCHYEALHHAKRISTEEMHRRTSERVLLFHRLSHAYLFVLTNMYCSVPTNK